MKMISWTLPRAALLILLATTATAQDSATRRGRRTPIVEVFEQCRNAVVNVSTTRRVQVLRRGSILDDIFDFGYPRVRDREIRSVGSGVLIHEDGYIVTNAHVVAQTSDINIIFADGRSVPARVVAEDHKHDLAVLKVDLGAPTPYVRLARGDDIMVGETVIAIGNPLGLSHSVTSGIVSAVGRELHFGDNTSYTGLIQTDAAINPGNSGGPLLNVNGELMGINTAIRGDAQNVGFAIPVARLWELLPTMLNIERRERVRFGLDVSGPSAEVVAVHPQSPAQQAGLRPGDRIVKFDGETLRDGIDYYVHLLGEKPGAAARLTYERDGRMATAAVALQPVPPPDGRELARKLLGVKLEEFDADTRRRYELEDIGVYVDEVTAGGPAADAGLLRGDMLLSVNGVAVTTLQQVGLALERVRPGDRVLGQLVRIHRSTPRRWIYEIHTRR